MHRQPLAPATRRTSRRTCIRRMWGSPGGLGCDRRSMLSLAKLAAGQGASYWLQQAQGRVTHAQSVASGVEDYYLAGPEAAGQWTGSAARAFGLVGEVEPEALTR